MSSITLLKYVHTTSLECIVKLVKSDLWCFHTFNWFILISFQFTKYVYSLQNMCLTSQRLKNTYLDMHRLCNLLQ